MFPKLVSRNAHFIQADLTSVADTTNSELSQDVQESQASPDVASSFQIFLGMPDDFGTIWTVQPQVWANWHARYRYLPLSYFYHRLLSSTDFLAVYIITFCRITRQLALYFTLFDFICFGTVVDWWHPPHSGEISDLQLYSVILYFQNQ